MSLKRSPAATLHLIVLGLIVGFIFSPLILSTVIIGLGRISGCSADDDGTSCAALGHGLGDRYLGESAADVFRLVTMPIGATAIALWCLILAAHVIHARAHHRERKSPRPF